MAWTRIVHASLSSPFSGCLSMCQTRLEESTQRLVCDSTYSYEEVSFGFVVGLKHWEMWLGIEVTGTRAAWLVFKIRAQLEILRHACFQAGVSLRSLSGLLFAMQCFSLSTTPRDISVRFTGCQLIRKVGPHLQIAAQCPCCTLKSSIYAGQMGHTFNPLKDTCILM